MVFDRSKFKGAKIKSIQEEEDKAKKNSKFFGGNDSGYIGFLKVEEGENEFRMCPAHNPDHSPYPIERTSMLKCKVDKFNEDGDKEGTEVKNKKIFIATQHSPKDSDGNNIITKDPIETYIDYVYRKADDLYGDDKDKKKKYLNPITGYRAGGKWNSGIRPSNQNVCYAFQDGKLGRLGLYQTWMKEMNAISLKESEDNVYAIDIFSDPDEGVPVIIDKDKENGKWVYRISSGAPKKPRRGEKEETWEDYYNRVRLTDSQLKQLSEAKPLNEIVGGVYSQKDFQLAVDGLTRFDEEHGYGIFDDSNFLDEMEEIDRMVPDATKKDSKKEEDEPAPDSVELTVDQMKADLEDYVQETYGDDHGLPQLTPRKIKIWHAKIEDGETIPVTDLVHVAAEKIAAGEEEEEQEETGAELDPDEDLKKQLENLRNSRRKK